MLLLLQLALGIAFLGYLILAFFVSGVPSTIRGALHWPVHSSHSSAIYDCYDLTRSFGLPSHRGL